jgi:hypothetical protein
MLSASTLRASRYAPLYSTFCGTDSRLVICLDGKGCAPSRTRGPQPVWQSFTPLRFVVAHRLALGAQGVVSRIRDPCQSWTEPIVRDSPCNKKVLAV